MNLPAKQRIRASFDRAAGSYDAAAVLQRAVCDRLLATLAGLPTPARILDAGCGTGYGAQLLRQQWPQAAITGTDFATAMLGHAARHTEHCVVADIEALPFAAGSFDLWWSSLTVQWCELPRVFAEAYRSLAPGGRLALSTLGGDTFAELRNAFAGIDGHAHTLDFSAAEGLRDAADAAGFRDLQLYRETLALHYPDLKTLLRAVKDIGANAVGDARRRGMMGKTTWQRIEADYERHRVATGLPARYDVVLLTAVR